MGNCLSSPEAKNQVANLETQAKAKGTEALDSLKTKLQGTGTGGQATAAEPAAAQTQGAATPAAGGVEGKLEQAVKAEEPKLEQEAKTEMTGAGGAGTAATPAATTTAT
ncbi:g10452 [Coccomyxa elongata]